ncbi:Uncharacterized protein dnm_069030 [Desulfonema magnum]|uniref:Uncharacterized protein n=1 Tax=Desulfonema magnum TaxID=45655 RepID=A0A975BSG3_9BACT|nr:Uncharacterized protein dnm_069030 [Desulfonema magnum]
MTRISLIEKLRVIRVICENQWFKPPEPRIDADETDCTD